MAEPVPPRSSKRKPLCDVSNQINTAYNTRKSLRLQQSAAIQQYDAASKPSMIPSVNRSISSLHTINEFDATYNNNEIIQQNKNKPHASTNRRQTMIPSASASQLPTAKPATKRVSTANIPHSSTATQPCHSIDTPLIDNLKQHIQLLATELNDEKQLTTDLEAENTSLLSTIESLQTKLSCTTDHTNCIQQYTDLHKQFNDKINEITALNEYNNMLELQVTELQSKLDATIQPAQKAIRNKRLSMLSSSISNLHAVREQLENDTSNNEQPVVKRQTRRSTMISMPTCFEPISLNKK